MDIKEYEKEIDEELENLERDIESLKELVDIEDRFNKVTEKIAKGEVENG